MRKPPKTTAQRQKHRRLMLSNLGYFKRRDFWLHPADEPILRKMEAALRRHRLDEIGEPPDKYCGDD